MTPTTSPAAPGTAHQGEAFDHDVVVVGSGFGGSVAALRLAEKGYDVLVLECGRRFEDEDFAKTSWDLRRYLWAPRLGCFGIQRIHLLSDVLVLAGSGVGGGSLVYANTLYKPGEAFFKDPQWAGITDWEAELDQHYETARRMLGVVDENPCEGPVEDMFRELARDMGREHTFRKTPVGVFFGRDGEREPDVTVPDPYFGGEGPARTGCTDCGQCMTGCRVGAKNTLMKNYLMLAERRGARIEALRTVVDVRPIDPAHPEEGWLVTSERSGAWFRKDRRTLRARQVVLAAGTWGTQTLMHTLKSSGVLPEVSDSLGVRTRTNSEALLGAMTDRVTDVDLTRGVAITSSFHPDENTHIENCRYGKGSDFMGAICLVMADGRKDGRKGPLRRIPTALGQVLRKPSILRFLVPPPAWRFASRTIIALVMQPLDNSITVRARKRLRGGYKLRSSQGHGAPNPTWIPTGHRAVRLLAEKLSQRTGRPTVAGSPVTDLLDIPMTAHFIGGCTIGASKESGVVDPYNRVWSYPGLSIVDGSSLTANLGVNPSLTITAQAERCFAMWPVKGEADPRPAQGEQYRTVAPVAPRRNPVRLVLATRRPTVPAPTDGTTTAELPAVAPAPAAGA